MTTQTLYPEVSKVVSDIIGTHDGQKAGPLDSTTAAAAFGSMLLGAVQQAYAVKPTAATPKTPQGGPSVTQADLASKDFWSFASDVVKFGIPIVTTILGKDYKQPTAEDVFATAPTSLTKDKDFWDFLDSALNTVVPAVLSAVNGKDFQIDAPPAVPAGKDKAWYDDALRIVAQVAPLVISALV